MSGASDRQASQLPPRTGRSILGFGGKPRTQEPAPPAPPAEVPKPPAPGGSPAPAAAATIPAAPPEVKAQVTTASPGAADLPPGNGTGIEAAAGGLRGQGPALPDRQVEPERGEAPAKRWPVGPDPTVDPCPKGNKTAAELWRARKAILDVEDQLARLDATRTLKTKAERTAFENWQRRERLTAEQEGVKAMRSEGVGADAIKQMAELAKAAGMTVQAYVAHLAAKQG